MPRYSESPLRVRVCKQCKKRNNHTRTSFCGTHCKRLHFEKKVDVDNVKVLSISGVTNLFIKAKEGYSKEACKQ